MMECDLDMIGFLILFPLIPAILLALVPGDGFRTWVTRLSVAALALVSLGLVLEGWGASAVLLEVMAPWAEHASVAVEILLYIFMLYGCRKIRKSEWWIPAVIVVQASWALFLELGVPHPEVTQAFLSDGLSTIMAFVIGVVGALCVLDAVGYMRDFHHHHHEAKDGRRWFFPVLFLFLSAMFLIVFSNHLMWLLLGWEATTLFSFLLIGYTGDETATRNSFRALGLNALGGLAFVGAVHYQLLVNPTPSLELSDMTARGALVMVPALLLGIAGIIKSAQMPFQSWLLGAMVAPTPVSALLHSSTMVKAGVYLLLRFAPVYQGTLLGTGVALVGGVTFLVTSLLAVSQTNAKRVLAYSTIANLGLIVACAGVGSHEALWAGFLLIIFHGVAKALLFLAVGSVEHQVGSRDIEDMDALILRHRGLAVMIMTGMMGMFVAPFGMLISKWACLVAFLKAQPLLAILLSFGSAPTLFFWTKWMGKIVASPIDVKKEETKLAGDEWTALGVLTVLTALVAVTYQPIAANLVEPILIGLYGAGTDLGPINQSNGFILLSMIILMVVFPLLFWLFKPSSKPATPYLSGLNVEGMASFRNPRNWAEVKAHSRNMYLTSVLPEAWLTSAGIWLTVGCLLLAVAGVVIQ
jgi:ech hydrogenase subunit A